MSSVCSLHVCMSVCLFMCVDDQCMCKAMLYVYLTSNELHRGKPLCMCDRAYVCACMHVCKTGDELC